MPALHFLLVGRRVENDAYGKEVIDSLKVALLFLHLLPNGMNRLCASFDVKVETGLLQFLTDRLDKIGDIGIALRLRLVQLVLDMVIGIVLQIFERKVFQFTFQLVEAQLVCERCIEIDGLQADLVLQFRVLHVTYLPHEVDPVCNHNKDDTHIFSKGEQEVAEVFCLYHRLFLV